MEFIVISGISGAGKSQAADILEDLGFYCVDNMPAVLIPRFAELCLAARGQYERVAIVTDVRSRGGFEALFSALDEMMALGCPYKILFMDASVEELVRRFKETRRRHPLESSGHGLEEAIRQEKRLLLSVRDRADFIVDTTGLTLGRLQRKIYQLFTSAKSGEKSLYVNVVAFGFKHGIPMDSDLVFDMRYLPNPYYMEDLRPQTGLDKPVSDFVFSHASAGEFMGHLERMLTFLLPLYIEEGKTSLTISIGCTGGLHRSVAVAEALSALIRGQGYEVETIHRDIEKREKRKEQA
ncbi:MAG: RNase adapter RapZ [Oscillospiraceae bacterium]|nr:RNase adapter RapZ [Oscillospiraceae bacterium]